MKKRSAITVAASLVVALLVGAIGMSKGLTGARGAAEVTPRVRTIERTITVHRKARAQAPRVVTITPPAAPNAVAAPAVTRSDEDEAGEDGIAGEHEDDSREDDGEFDDD
jgi:hypothetical protein